MSNLISYVIVATAVYLNARQRHNAKVEVAVLWVKAFSRSAAKELIVTEYPQYADYDLTVSEVPDFITGDNDGE